MKINKVNFKLLFIILAIVLLFMYMFSNTTVPDDEAVDFFEPSVCLNK